MMQFHGITSNGKTSLVNNNNNNKKSKKKMISQFIYLEQKKTN